MVRLRIRSVLRVVMRVVYFLTGSVRSSTLPGAEGRDRSPRSGSLRAQSDRRAASGQPADGGAGLAVRALDRPAVPAADRGPGRRPGAARAGRAAARRPGRPGAGLRPADAGPVRAGGGVRRGAGRAGRRDLRVLLHPAGDRRGGQRPARHGAPLPGHLPGPDRGPAGRAAADPRRRPCGCGPTAPSRRSPTCCTARSPGRSTTSWSGATTGWRPTTWRWWSTTATPASTRWSAATTCCRRRSSQAYLARLLGYPVPTYAHVPLALNAEGRRLAKRDGAVTLADLAARGVRRRRCWACSPPRSACRRRPRRPSCCRVFDPARLPREPWVVDPASVTA